MRSKIIFIVLFMLSLNVFHDSFISLIDKSVHANILHYADDQSSSLECDEFTKIHNMFHFMAIVNLSKNAQVQFAKRETIPHIVVQYTPPYKKTSYKPPTV